MLYVRPVLYNDCQRHVLQSRTIKCPAARQTRPAKVHHGPVVHKYNRQFDRCPCQLDRCHSIPQVEAQSAKDHAIKAAACCQAAVLETGANIQVYVRKQDRRQEVCSESNQEGLVINYNFILIKRKLNSMFFFPFNSDGVKKIFSGSTESSSEYRRDQVEADRNKKAGRNLPHWCIYISWFCKYLSLVIRCSADYKSKENQLNVLF